MTLYFSLKAPDGTLHSPGVCCAELEIQLEVLNSFVANGNVLVSAYLLDEKGKRFDLPVEAFDGSSIVDHLLQLTREYHQVLRVLS
ncbi:hypothetical protein EXU85_26045 [Spirosoma sp. KCTC 42546]|uniref:hypothetical protein n=1 Tax=Spirosoma sp. KCTC 42546 TaxID=2520506 RepID=UPI00115ACA6D|nr:hypothetical protein [Spirosoma sp. KCTC 42546]QDK81884.1 hypothetical protein EXU85_26045 [Spirosoma sp. KCTC 42546]